MITVTITLTLALTTFQVLANGTAAYQLPTVTYEAGPDVNQIAKAGYQAAVPAGTQTIPTAFQQQQTYTVAAAMMPPTNPAVFASAKPAPMSNISMPPAFSNSILQVLRCLLLIAHDARVNHGVFSQACKRTWHPS